MAIQYAKDILTVGLILFAVIDILGSIPVLVDIKQKAGHIHSAQATLSASFIMVLFLLTGESLLGFIGIDVASFAIAGSIVIFALGLEMVLGIDIFKADAIDPKSASIVPIAFPLVAGAGTLTTILSLKTQYSIDVIAIAVVVNAAIVYGVLKSVPFIERRLGNQGIQVLRRVFGIILLAISIKLFKTNIWL